MKAKKNGKKTLSAGVVTNSDSHLQKIFVNLHLFSLIYQASCIITVDGTVSF